jgi:hypothetical protein
MISYAVLSLREFGQDFIMSFTRKSSSSISEAEMLDTEISSVAWRIYLSSCWS